MLVLEQVVIALLLLLSVGVLTFTGWVLLGGAGSALLFVYKSLTGRR